MFDRLHRPFPLQVRQFLGLARAYFGGGIVELIGAAVAFAFIRYDSLRRPAL